jgi:TRAP-type C4-dicarboxylate transport system permease small subunit
VRPQPHNPKQQGDYSGQKRGIHRVFSLRWLDGVIEAAGYLCGLSLVVATLSVLYGVLVRYLFKEPTTWQTELATYLLIAVTCIGAAYGLKHHVHVGVGIVVDRLPVKVRLTVHILTATLALCVVMVVMWTSTEMWHEAFVSGSRSNTSWAIPLSVVYSILPVGMVLVGLQYCRLIIDAVRCFFRGMPQSALLLGPSSNDLFTGDVDESTPGNN